MPRLIIERPYTEALRHANLLLRCKKCIGGTVMDFQDGRRCINCGTEHDENGELVKPRMEQPTEGGRSLFKVR